MFPPPTPDAVTGSCEVRSQTTDEVYEVNLDEMECTCKHGAAWRWDNKRWKHANLCSHKLKAVASLGQSNPDDETLMDFYEESVGSRFNAFEAVSALHKELLRGDTEKALYWATVIVPHRGRHGVIQYMRRIAFEETRDLALYRYCTKVSSKGQSVSHLEMQRAVRRFAAAPKKWELPWRKDIFINEQRGYAKLVEEFGNKVAGGGDAIDEEEAPRLRECIIQGFQKGDKARMQYGLKGLYKSKCKDKDELKVGMLNLLISISDNEYTNSFEHDSVYVNSLYDAIMLKIRLFGDIRYHELNAFADALSGEPGRDAKASLPAVKHKRIINTPKEWRLPLGALRKIPLYAQDNHTWAGKAKMRNYRPQLNPGAKQTDLDFRICGAYMGVGWRTLAIEQHGTIDCNWGDVKWHPNWLWSHLDQMFY